MAPDEQAMGQVPVPMVGIDTNPIAPDNASINSGVMGGHVSTADDERDSYWNRAMGKAPRAVAPRPLSPAPVGSPAEPVVTASRVPEAPKAGRRRWGLVPVGGAIVALVAGLGGGAAFALWSTHGSGSGSAKARTSQNVTVEAATGTVSSYLVPNGSTADLTLTITNPNPFTVNITNISQNGTSFNVSGGNGCTSANSGVTVPTQSGLSVPVSPGTNVVVHIANGAMMSTTSNSGCQNASFQIPVFVTVHQ
jgi:hypothetical protein